MLVSDEHVNKCYNLRAMVLRTRSVCGNHMSIHKAHIQKPDFVFFAQLKRLLDKLNRGSYARDLM